MSVNKHYENQSIWIKGGFKNGRKIVFCHAYREHTNTLGSSLQSQRECLVSFLQQWEWATELRISGQPSEIHIMGDMNLDCLNEKWLSPTYHLYTLSKLVQEACDKGNFSQLVKDVTRYQNNKVTGTTSMSCIDHVYTNQKFRCSSVTVSPFGNSDHELISYIRVSKEPPCPSRMIRRRTYKNFVKDDFLRDLSKINWSPVYSCQDVDIAVQIFTSIFKEVLNLHAPWISYQLKKKFTPWVTKETKTLIKRKGHCQSRGFQVVSVRS